MSNLKVELEVEVDFWNSGPDSDSFWLNSPSQIDIDNNQFPSNSLG